MAKFCPIVNENVTYMFCDDCGERVCRDGNRAPGPAAENRGTEDPEGKSAESDLSGKTLVAECVDLLRMIRIISLADACSAVGIAEDEYDAIRRLTGLREKPFA